ncbi:hypothetical protein Tco_1070383 [Tanacetum coccineum]|uniref:Uncharacterized protein n=1 Tax=Tanacetum coccineum TaxID=301880 RepID=A0ABQ5HLA8_9ASTR
MKIGGCYEDVSRPSVVGVLVSGRLYVILGVKVGNGEDFFCIGCMLPLMYQLMAVKKTSFPEMECSGSIVKSEKFEDSSQMVTSVSILEEQSK